MKNNIIQNAVGLAIKYHGPRTRKVDGDPELVHPVMVATIVAQQGFADEIIAAAYCHDLLEDTNCSEDEIRQSCSEDVLTIVKAVTNDDILEWEKKKLEYIKSVENGPYGAKAVCIADKIHNAGSLIKSHEARGSVVWKSFNRGKDKKLWFEKQLLEMLRKTIDHPLVNVYSDLLGKIESLEG